MVYACHDLSLGKDWNQLLGFLNTTLKRGDELIVIGDLFAQKSPDLKTLLMFDSWIHDFDITVYHMWKKEHVILKEKTASDMLSANNVKVCREDFPFVIENKSYLLSPEFAKSHEYDKINPDYYICSHDPLLYGGKSTVVLKLPNALHTENKEGGLMLLTKEGPTFIANEYSPKNIEVDIKSSEDLTLIEKNTLREIPNAMTVNVDAELMKDQKFRVQLQEHLKNGGIKNLKIVSEETQEAPVISIPIETEDMFDLEKLKEKVKKKISESSNTEKGAAEKIFDKIFATYLRTQKIS